MSWKSTLALCGLLAGLGVAGAIVARLPEPVASGLAVAIDGDSLRLDGRELRLKGIDAPEYRQLCQGPHGETPCGRDARRALADMLARGPAVCRIEGRDRYGRDLARCRVGDMDLNATMVLDGMAVAFGDYEREEAEAKARRKGLWTLTFEPPSVWREKHAAEARR